MLCYAPPHSARLWRSCDNASSILAIKLGYSWTLLYAIRLSAFFKGLSPHSEGTIGVIFCYRLVINMCYLMNASGVYTTWVQVRDSPKPQRIYLRHQHTYTRIHMSRLYQNISIDYYVYLSLGIIIDILLRLLFYWSTTYFQLLQTGIANNIGHKPEIRSGAMYICQVFTERDINFF